MTVRIVSHPAIVMVCWTLGKAFPAGYSGGSQSCHKPPKKDFWLRAVTRWLAHKWQDQDLSSGLSDLQPKDSSISILGYLFGQEPGWGKERMTMLGVAGGRLDWQQELEWVIEWIWDLSLLFGSPEIGTVLKLEGVTCFSLCSGIRTSWKQRESSRQTSSDFKMRKTLRRDGTCILFLRTLLWSFVQYWFRAKPFKQLTE